jgi:hypothetical protein
MGMRGCKRCNRTVRGNRELSVADEDRTERRRGVGRVASNAVCKWGDSNVVGCREEHGKFELLPKNIYLVKTECQNMGLKSGLKCVSQFGEVSWLSRRFYIRTQNV